jgi:hypothetical protein
LSPVVGFNTLKSTSVKLSPLFVVRAKRAVNKESQGLKCEYVGKGEEVNLLFPTLDSRTALAQKVVDRIKTMDDTEFNKFIDLAINHMKKDNTIEKGKTEEIITILHQLKDNLKESKKLPLKRERFQNFW